MSTKQFTLKLPPQVIENLEKVAAGQHMRPTAFAALWLAKVSDLKAEHGLDAITSIPKELFKGRAGRPIKEEVEIPTA